MCVISCQTAPLDSIDMSGRLSATNVVRWNRLLDKSSQITKWRYFFVHKDAEASCLVSWNQERPRCKDQLQAKIIHGPICMLRPFFWHSVSWIKWHNTWYHDARNGYVVSNNGFYPFSYCEGDRTTYWQTYHNGLSISCQEKNIGKTRNIYGQQMV